MPPTDQLARQTPETAGGNGSTAGVQPIPPINDPPPIPNGAPRVESEDLAASEARFREAINRSPHDAKSRHNLAVILARQGRLAPAIAEFQAALEHDSDSAETHRNLALALSRQGRAYEAEEHWREALRLAPDLPAARHEFGNALRIAGRLEEGAVHLREAVRLLAEAPAPEQAEAHHSLGLALAELKQPVEARACYERALEIRPDFPEALCNLGIVLEDVGSHAEAEARYRQALALLPRSADTLNNLGVTLAAMRRHEEAVVCYRNSLEIKPGAPLTLNNLGNALRTLGDVDEAIASLKQAMQIRPDYAEAHNNLGICLMELGRREEAVACYEQALHLRPDYPEAHLNRSLAWLGEGEFARGWTEYEWRWFGKEIKRRSFKQPLWSGARAKNQTLFVYFEQGMGDTFQFIRYVEMARRRVGRVVVEVQKPLAPLLSRCRGIDQIIPAGQAPPQFDTYIPLMSLAGAFGTQLETIPAEVPYIFAAPEKVESWKQRLGETQDLRVAIGWQGNPQYRGDRQRSIPLEHFAPLAEISGVQLISLQKGEGAGQIEKLERPFPLVAFDDLDSTGGAFTDTAAILQNVDLLVTSDTALPHLAGAMGIETWVALPFAADWRWFRERDDSPWYPTLRLFRQEQRGDWKGVFEMIARELAAHGARRNGAPQRAQVPAAARADFDRGTALAREGKLDEAITVLRTAVATHDDYAEAHHNLGVALARTRKYEEAISAFRRSLELDPGYGEAAANLGLACLESGQPGDAVSALRQAVQSGRTTHDVYNHLGVALARTRRNTEAIEAYRTALRLKPDFAAAHVNLGHAYLALERFEEAWLESEWRWDSQSARPFRFRKPRWSGEAPQGRTVLIYADETKGEILSHLRHVISLHERGARVIVACRPEVLAILSHAPGVFAAVPLGGRFPDHDLYVPLMSLPWLLRKS